MLMLRNKKFGSTIKMRFFHFKKILIISLLITSSTLCITKTNNENNNLNDESGENSITAKEGYLIALEEAIKWNASAKLYFVDRNGPITNGQISYWKYRFGNIVNDTIEKIDIFISKNHSYICRNNNYYGPLKIPITDWEIDSYQAYVISISDPTIGEFIDKYNCKERIREFLLGYFIGPEVVKNHLAWYICWYDEVADKDYKGAKIYIDAITGEILYVNASE